MGRIQMVIAVVTLINHIWDAIKEKNDELKKRKTESIQSGARGIIDGDASRIVGAFSLAPQSQYTEFPEYFVTYKLLDDVNDKARHCHSEENDR